MRNTQHHAARLFLRALLLPARAWRVPLASLAFCLLYVFQVIPHAHAQNEAPATTPVHHADHSHSPDTHHHHHDEASSDGKRHHHHALSWHLDLHFARSADDGLEIGGGNGPALLPAPVSLRGNRPHAARRACRIGSPSRTPIASLPPRGPPATG